MNPLQLRKAGGVVQSLEHNGFNREQINDVCRALFLDQSDEDMHKAFAAFAVDDKAVNVTEIQESLPCPSGFLSPY